MKKQFSPGDKVIVVDSKGTVEVGYFVRLESFGKPNTAIPTVNINGKDYFVGGIIRHYDDDLMTILINTVPEERWRYLLNLKHIEEVPKKHTPD